MGIRCDICNMDITPDYDEMEDDDSEDEEDVKILRCMNKSIYFCDSCYEALENFVLSGDFKKIVTKYANKQ